MKIHYFSSLIWNAFKNHGWAKVSNIHQTADGWTFVVTDLVNGQEYVCCAYPVKSEKFVAPNTVDELLKNQGEKE